MLIPPILAEYTKATGGGEMVESSLTIPRQPKLWSEWGLLKKKEEEINVRLPLGDLHISLFFPKTLLSASCSNKPALRNDSKKNNHGFVKLNESLDLSAVPDAIPIIVAFHGGGFSIGHPDGLELLKLFTKMLVLQEKRSSDKGPAQAVFALVDYSLAPDFPFPAAPTDATTALAYFLETYPHRTIHVMGLSVGATLAVVSAMECLRCYHSVGCSRIGSMLCSCPMLNPATDSVSYYRNQFSHVPSISWLLWMVRAYLELPTAKGEDKMTSTHPL